MSPQLPDDHSLLACLSNGIMDTDPQSKLEQTIARWLQAIEQLHQWYEKLDKVIVSLKSVDYRPSASSLVQPTSWTLTKLVDLQTDVYQLMVGLEAQPWIDQFQTVLALIALLTDDTKRITYWTDTIRQALEPNTSGTD